MRDYLVDDLVMCHLIYYLRSQIYDTVDFFENFDHSSYSKYLFKNINFKLSTNYLK
jgi:hypothetical protein